MPPPADAEPEEGSRPVSDPDAVRKQWARRITERYDGWPERPGPEAASGEVDPRTAAPDQAGRTASGWVRGVAPDEVDKLDLALTMRQHTGETARALRAERAYWGLDPEDD